MSAGWINKHTAAHDYGDVEDPIAEEALDIGDMLATGAPALNLLGEIFLDTMRQKFGLPPPAPLPVAPGGAPMPEPGMPQNGAVPPGMVPVGA